MNDTLTKNLFAAFPGLYAGRTKSPEQSAMCWGFQCGDGWYQIIYELSHQLQEYAIHHPELSLEVMQVKSKFGQLRFHLNEHDEHIDQLISFTCKQAKSIDEYTGKTKIPIS